MTTKQPRADEDLFTYESEHKLRLENEAWLIQKYKEELAARDQEIKDKAVQVAIDFSKKYWINRHVGEPVPMVVPEKMFKELFNQAIDALVKETDVK